MKTLIEIAHRPLPLPIKSRSLVLWVALTLTACGSDQTSVPETPDAGSTALTTGRVVEVSAGNRLVNTSPAPARIRIDHHPDSGQRQLTLLEGSADLF
jgi:hypothetical protein